MSDVFKSIVSEIDEIGLRHPMIAFGPPPIEGGLFGRTLVYSPRFRCYVFQGAISTNDPQRFLLSTRFPAYPAPLRVEGDVVKKGDRFVTDDGRECVVIYTKEENPYNFCPFFLMNSPAADYDWVAKTTTGTLISEPTKEGLAHE